MNVLIKLNRASFLEKLLIIKKYFYFRVRRFLQFWKTTGQICWERDVFSLAQSLSYVTVLSLVPIFIIFFFVISSISQDTAQLNDLLGTISQFILPDYTDKLVDILNQLSQQSLNLGLIGFPSLLVMGVFLYLKVDGSINRLWSSTDSRSIFTSVTAFVNSALVGPVLIVAALSMPTYLKFLRLYSGYNFESLINNLLIILPFITTMALFTALYYFVPTDKVSLRSCIIGSFWTAILVRVTNFGLEVYFRNFAKYDVIYGSLTMLPVLMFWLYVMWLLVLFGSVLVYVHQTFSHKKFIITEKGFALDSNLTVALKILLLLTYNYLHRKAAPDLIGLCYTFNVDKQRLQNIIKHLCANKILSLISGGSYKSSLENRYQLYCDPDKIKLHEIYDLYVNENAHHYVPSHLNLFFNELSSNKYLKDKNASLLDIYNYSGQIDTKLLSDSKVDHNYTIFIKDLDIDCYIGVNEWEKNVKQPITIALKIDFDATLAASNDDITKTIDYSWLVSFLIENISNKKYALLETAVEDIANLMVNQFGVKSVWVEVSKKMALSADTKVSMQRLVENKLVKAS